MHFSYYIGDRVPFTFWKTVTDGMDAIHIVDVVLVVGLLYIVATYYQGYRNSDDRSPVVAGAAVVADDDDSSGARGNEPRSNRLDAGRDKNDRGE